MAEIQNFPREHGGQPLFIDGYFTKRIFKGETPEYGYPKNHLPEVGDGASMEVVSGFIASLESAK